MYFEMSKHTYMSRWEALERLFTSRDLAPVAREPTTRQCQRWEARTGVNIDASGRKAATIHYRTIIRSCDGDMDARCAINLEASTISRERLSRVNAQFSLHNGCNSRSEIK